MPYPAQWSPPQKFAEFQFVRTLGQGSMGLVCLYEDTTLKRDVAVKFLISHARGAEEARRRFLVEAQAIARLSHPNVLTVHRTGDIGGVLYLVSEYVRGKTLGDLQLPRSWQEVLRIGTELAAGLAEAHKRGVLHRDIKPTNAMMDADGRIKLCDFGLAKLVSASDPSSKIEPPPIFGPDEETHLLGKVTIPDTTGPVKELGTIPGAIMGTPLYMSPESWRGESATPQMDVYSLGVLLYELCTGQPLFDSPNLLALSMVVQSDDPPLVPRSIVPAPLADIIDRCVKRDPALRFPSALELNQALLTCSATIVDNRRRSQFRKRIYMATGCLVGIALCAIGILQGYKYFHRHTLAKVTGGSFRMGSMDADIDAAFLWCQSEGRNDCNRATYERERPSRQVHISSFFLERTEVTNKKFAAFLNQLGNLHLKDDLSPPVVPSRYVFDDGILLIDLHPHASGILWHNGHFVARPGWQDRPVVQVTWDGATRYCAALNRRLPTEAEWEFAARGPNSNRFPWGPEVLGCRDAVYGRKPGYACASLPNEVAEVASSKLDRTRDGIYDLGGNVSEWVADRFEPYPLCEGVCIDPLVGNVSKIGEPTDRVIRGGSFVLPASALRSAARSHRAQNSVTRTVGFRCGASLK